MHLLWCVQHEILGSEEIDGQYDFLNAKEGQCSLQITLYLTSQAREPEIVRFLAQQQGISVHVTFDGTTPIERIDMYGWLRNGQSQFSVFKAPTENCADTNGRCFAIRKKTDRRYLFLHVHA